MGNNASGHREDAPMDNATADRLMRSWRLGVAALLREQLEEKIPDDFFRLFVAADLRIATGVYGGYVCEEGFQPRKMMRTDVAHVARAVLLGTPALGAFIYRVDFWEESNEWMVEVRRVLGSAAPS